MKPCKSCHKEIDDLASKCPYCQAFQVWYRNPQVYGMLFPLVLIPVIFFSTGMWGKKEFADYSKLFDVNQISCSVDGDKIAIVYSIENKSEVKWNRLSYEVIGYDDKNMVNFTKTNSEFSWVIEPHGVSHLTVELENRNAVKRWALKISELNAGRF